MTSRFWDFCLFFWDRRPGLRFTVWVQILGERLYLQPFHPKSCVLKKASSKIFLVSIKRNFLKKTVFYNCEENVQVHFGALQVHFIKSLWAFWYIRWLSWTITKLPFNKGSSEYPSSFLVPLISSLYSAQSQLPYASHLFSQLMCLQPQNGRTLW